MCCVEFIAKYVLFFFNLVFVLIGLAFVGVGIAALIQLNEITDLVPVLNTVAVLIIVVGGVIFLISFFGCCGAITERGCLLVLYAVCMIILAGAKIYLAVMIFNNLADLITTVEGWVNTAFKNNGVEPDGSFRALEALFQCCGTTGVESYQSLNFIPSTCCANTTTLTCEGAVSFYEGCTSIITDYLSNFGNIIGIAIIIIICIELIAMIFSLFLNQQITRAKRLRY